MPCRHGLFRVLSTVYSTFRFYAKYGLDEKEIAFIEEKVTPME
jgi:hypothetical protein